MTSSSDAETLRILGEIYRDVDRDIAERLGLQDLGAPGFARAYREKHARRFAETVRFVLPYVREGDRVCEVGVGAGELSILLRRLRPVRLVGTDRRNAFTTALERSGYFSARDIEFHYWDLVDEGAPRAADCDVALFCETLEHVPVDPVVAIRRVAELLRPGGRLVLTTPNFATLRNRLALLMGVNPTGWWPRFDDPYGPHVREYTHGELARFIGAAGLELEEVRMSYAITLTHPAPPIIRLPYLALVWLIPPLRDMMLTVARK